MHELDLIGGIRRADVLVHLAHDLQVRDDGGQPFLFPSDDEKNIPRFGLGGGTQHGRGHVMDALLGQRPV